MGKYKIIDIDIYKIHPTIFVGSLKEFLSFVESCKDEENKGLIEQIKEDINQGFNYGASTYWDNKNRSAILYFPKLSTSLEGLEIVVHELSHLVFLILGDVGVEVDMRNNEAFAYLLGWLMKEVMDKKGYKKVEPHQNTAPQKWQNC